jgi:hypothetical protein
MDELQIQMGGSEKENQSNNVNVQLLNGQAATASDNFIWATSSIAVHNL